MCKSRDLAKQVLSVLLFAAVLSGAAAAQSTQGYVFFTPGQMRASGASAFAMQFGGGAKWVARNGLGIGAELSMAGPKDHFSDFNFGVTSVNGYYYIKTGHQKLDPFVTGGYSRTFGHESGANWGNFGGGLNYWFHSKVGCLLEFRDHLHRESGITAQLWGVRFGLAFRSGE